MQIIGFNLSKISIERKEKLDKELNIKSDIDITNVSKDSIPIAKQEVLKLDFKFNIKYNDGELALNEFLGHMLLLPDPEEYKKVTKSWKDKQISDELRIPIFNFIMSKCNIKALQLEDEMGLPLHIPLPRINPKKE
jgi:hypothetical protein